MKLQFDLKFLLITKEFTRIFNALVILIVCNFICHAQNPNEKFLQIETLEQELSDITDYQKPSNPTKDNLIAYINKLEIDIDKREQIKSEYINLEKLILNTSIDTNELTKDPKDNNKLKSVRDKMIQEVYLDKLSGNSNQSSDIAIKELYILQLNQHLDLEGSHENASQSNLDALHSVCIEKIALHEDKIDALKFEMDQLMESIKNLKLTTPNQNKSASNASNKSSNAKYNLSAKKYITSLNQQNLNYQPNFGIDNKTFEDRKGFMNWPLADGQRIARYQEVIGNVRLNGTLIESNDNIVKTVAQGMVGFIGSNADGSKFVIIKHDKDFYSLYSNLKEVYVIQNQTLKYEQSIGIADKGKNGKNIIQFQIWDKNQTLNPSRWLKNK
ncbi:MAG: peptidoglycan DD-metalloendopeptidase family protein [Saprospiraceae bacterium]|nr:peptidoglycan DD-metalloendopeptidase family protein [Bacteroidia bacterium]NNE13688.1 peptidoglycan DD-metalloendopeptidase family protein [Saprospiraceae bacterium]NNL90791.1 peptidoglycan DD-metalloendopeptidase family protein [Saprospiraceae bacterium]